MNRKHIPCEDQDPCMDTKEAAALWGVTVQKVRSWCRSGMIEPQPVQRKSGSPWRILRDAVPLPLVKNN